VLLEIEDNGTGIAENQPSAPRHCGNGLIGIRERVLMLNGTLEIAAGTEGGTRITVNVPRCRGRQEDGENE
jgi:two-component system sensor histidine kinase DesK